MKKMEIEKKLKCVIDNSVPDCVDEILAKCENKKGFIKKVDVVMNERKIKNKNGWFIPRLAGALSVVMLCVIGTLGVRNYNKVYKVDSTINFDVNPSVELKINKDEKIIDAVPLNKDGKIVLDDMDLEKVDLDVAVNAIIGSMLKNGYISIDENSILVSVKNKDVNKANKLKEEISQEIKEILNASSISGSVLAQAYDNDNEANKLANENDVSEGKARLINNILETNITDRNGQAYTFEALSKLSINELNLLLTAKKAEINDTNTSTQGTASENSYIGKEKAKSIAFKNAEVSSNKVKNLKVEIDADDGILVYDIEFNIGNIEYEYEINAKTGVIIEKDIDKENNEKNNISINSSDIDDDDDDNDDDFDDDDDDDED